MDNENKVTITEQKEKAINPKSALIVQTIKQVENSFTPEKFQEEKLYILNDLLKENYKYQMFEKNPTSLRSALIDLSASKLTLNPVLKYCYLVPRKNEITLMISYKGIMKLLIDDGTVKTIEAHEVWNCDFFEVQYGNEKRITHKPDFIKREETITMGKTEVNSYKLIGFYAVAKLHNDEILFEFMSLKEINKIKNCAQTKNVWDNWFEEMAKKTAIKRLAKNLVTSTYIAEVIKKDNELSDFNFKQTEQKTSKIDDVEFVEE